MTPEAQRIAIAEACGWTGCTDVKCEWRKAQHLHKHNAAWFFESYTDGRCRVPNYLSDLNAINNALGLIVDDEAAQARYVDHLRAICGDSKFNCIHATASQRCEAFLRTLNLWKP